MLKIATWNVNSLRVRLPQLLDWLNSTRPDIMALQETKVTDQQFPLAALQASGYHVIFAGQKTYNGVALLSRMESQEVMTDFPSLADPQRRILGATYGRLRILNVYVPNGGTVDSEKYQYKLNWLKHLHKYIGEIRQYYPHLIVLGDFNIAPTNQDVHDPPTWDSGVMVSPAERAALQTLLTLGLHDTFRLFEQPAETFSWWDYRAQAVRRNHGVRIDLILASTPLIGSCSSCIIDKVPRHLNRPSDHAPVIATFDFDGCSL